MTLEGITNEMPTAEDLANFQNYVAKESDRGSAIMTGALVEQALFVALRSRLPHITEDETKNWFLGPNAAFRSFEAKTKLGRALNMYNEDVEGRLDLIRRIRNAFAHRSLPIGFDHPVLKPLVDQLDPTEGLATDSVKLIFWTYSLAIALLLWDIPKAEPSDHLLGPKKGS